MTANLAALEPRAHPEAAGGPETLRLGMPQLALGGLSEGWLLRECAPGEGGRFVESGATSPGGRVPVNTSGGLVSKSHPVDATGLAMTYELVTQLRGEAGERQVRGAEIALQHNAGAPGSRPRWRSWTSSAPRACCTRRFPTTTGPHPTTACAERPSAPFALARL